MILKQMLMKSNYRGMRLPTVFAFVLLVAFNAIIVLLFNVCPKVCWLGEPVSTDSTLKRFFSGVNDNVMQEGLASCELLVTDAAHKQLIPRVNSLVLLHISLPLELLSTVGVRTFIAVFCVQLLGFKVDHQVAS